MGHRSRTRCVTCRCARRSIGYKIEPVRRAHLRRRRSEVTDGVRPLEVAGRNGSGRRRAAADHGRIADAMLRFILTRVSLVIPTFIGVTLLRFLLIHLIPGDPIEMLAGRARHRPGAPCASCVHEFGLDQPLLVQYVDLYRAGRSTAISARSIITHEPVIDEFLQLFPATIELSLCAMLFADRRRPAGRHHRGGQARHGLRPRPDGRCAHRLFDADLLVGPAADPAVLGHARLDAGLGPHRRSL